MERNAPFHFSTNVADLFLFLPQIAEIMSSIFFPTPQTVNDVFKREVKYIIPEYQRPYLWDCLGKNEKNNQINVMWDDLYASFINEPDEIYFLGSMVVIGEDGNLTFEVVDGQQRLTSLALLFVAIKCFLSDRNKEVADNGLKMAINQIIDSIEDLLYNKKMFGGLPKEKKVKIEKNAGFDYDKIIEDVFECNAYNASKFEKDSNEERSVVKRYYENKKYFESKIEEFFIEQKKFDFAQAERLNAFYDFLKNKVSVVSIKTGSFDIAYHIFEILNNRGLQLSNKDLLRNFIIKEFEALKMTNKDKYSSLVPFSKWQELDDDNVLDNEFIGRWVESHNASQQRTSAFNDLKKIYENEFRDEKLKKKIELFHEELKSSVACYSKIVEIKFENPTLKQKVNVILNAGNSRYSVNFLLALLKFSKGEETKEMIDLVNLYERKLWFYLLDNTRFSSSDIYKAIAKLNEKNVSEAKKYLEDFGHKNIQEVLTKTLNEDLSNDTGKLLLAKYIWIQETETKDDVVTQHLHFSDATLEHIYPQKPLEKTNWLSNKFLGKGEKIYSGIYRLGNMTLVTQKLNAAAKNYDFKKKKLEYAKTKLPMTYELSQLGEAQMDKAYLQKRQTKITHKILTDLGFKTK